jgi:hypothetical protein
MYILENVQILNLFRSKKSKIEKINFAEDIWFLKKMFGF